MELSAQRAVRGARGAGLVRRRARRRRLVAMAALAAIAGCGDAADTSAELGVLHAFSGADGAWSRGSLVRGGSVLYGRTAVGGAENSGTVFRIDEGGAGFARLYSFTAGGDNVLGNQPHHNAMLLEGGTLLGAALYGGNTDGAAAPSGKPTPPPAVQEGNGTIFTLDTSGEGYAVLAPLYGGATSPAQPHSPPMRAPDGTLYGMTAAGGQHGGGTLYAIAPRQAPRILHDFDAKDGDEPHGVVVLDSSRTRLLGMTRHGGTPASGKGAGVIFAYEIATGAYSVLHTFVENDPNDGATNDHGFLTLVDGVAYGLTELGGARQLGTLFRIGEDGGGFALLHSFGDGATDGQEPYGSLVPVGEFLYGTTTEGGQRGDGAIFRYRPRDGRYEVLASFDRRTTGAFPEDNVVASDDGRTLFGLTQAGGAHDPDASSYYGTVFALSVPRGD